MMTIEDIDRELAVLRVRERELLEMRARAVAEVSHAKHDPAPSKDAQDQSDKHREKLNENNPKIPRTYAARRADLVGLDRLIAEIETLELWERTDRAGYLASPEGVGHARSLQAYLSAGNHAHDAGWLMAKARVGAIVSA
jgi:hypothetical protein